MEEEGNIHIAKEGQKEGAENGGEMFEQNEHRHGS